MMMMMMNNDALWLSNYIYYMEAMVSTIHVYTSAVICVFEGY